jgi:hypothetical protein
MGAGPEAGGAAPFDPSTITGLQAWYKADAGTSTTTDGATVTTWNDSSVNARNLAIDTGTPLYKAAIQNGLPIVRYTADRHSAVFTNAQPQHAFVVAKSRAADTGTFLDARAFNTMRLFRDTTTTLSLFAGSTAPTVTFDPALVFNVFSVLFSGASSEIRINGGGATIGNAGTGGAGAGVTVGNIGVGTVVQASAVDIGEVLLYSVALSAANRQAVEAYLKSKWNTP